MRYFIVFLLLALAGCATVEGGTAEELAVAQARCSREHPTELAP